MGAEILNQLTGQGFKFAVKQGQLFVEPKHRLSNEARALIREHKADILATLAATPIADIADETGLPRPEAEMEAARITATLARNRGYAWASLRAAFAEYPELLAALPDNPGPVDALPLGVARLAVLRGGRIVRQGAFAGAHEVRP